MAAEKRVLAPEKVTAVAVAPEVKVEAVGVAQPVRIDASFSPTITFQPEAVTVEAPDVTVQAVPPSVTVQAPSVEVKPEFKPSITLPAMAPSFAPSLDLGAESQRALSTPWRDIADFYARQEDGVKKAQEKADEIARLLFPASTLPEAEKTEPGHMSPEAGRAEAERMGLLLGGALAVTIAASIAAEVIGLGQIEAPIYAAQMAWSATGMGGILTDVATGWWRFGVAPAYAQAMRAQYTPEIPGPGDLIRFVVREVITPARFKALMPYHGYGPDFTDAYWEAHWVLVPPDRVRTAFLRGLISEEEYRKFLVWQDYKPEPRPGIKASDVDLMLETQYDIPGRLDMRWLAEWGFISPADLRGLLEKDGMDPVWAGPVSEAWVLNQLREEYGRVRDVLARKLREGFLSKDQFTKGLKELHFGDHVINALSRWADEDLDLAERRELQEEAVGMAKDGLITSEALAQRLRAIGMAEARITREMASVKRVVEIRREKEEAKALKETKAEELKRKRRIDALLRLRDEAQARAGSAERLRAETLQALDAEAVRTQEVGALEVAELDRRVRVAVKPEDRARLTAQLTRRKADLELSLRLLKERRDVAETRLTNALLAAARDREAAAAELGVLGE